MSNARASLKDQLWEFAERCPDWPIIVSPTAAWRRSRVGSYVWGKSLSEAERRAVREQSAWVVFQDDSCKVGWRVVVKLGCGYYFRSAPARLVKRLANLPTPASPVERLRLQDELSSGEIRAISRPHRAPPVLDS
jgi:hypothetical protein